MEQTPLKAIKAKCLDCSGNIAAEVKRCDYKACPLWEYRLGSDPKQSRRKEKRK